MRSLVCTIVLALALVTSAGCGKKDGGGGAEKVDVKGLKDGDAKTVKLKFWMLERGLVGEDLVPVVHWDDGGNQRLVMTYDDGVKAKLEGLKQGAVVKVTFTAKTGDDVSKGNVTAVE